jgi:hypothetical protein
MADTAALLAAYDGQMRMPTGAVPSGVTYEHDGPVVRIVGGHVGRVRAPRDVGVTGARLDRLIARQRDRFRALGQGVEWKVRAHDLPTELPERLVAAGFVPEEPSTVLLGSSPGSRPIPARSPSWSPRPVSGSSAPPGRCTTRAPTSSRCSAARRCRSGGDVASIAP